MISTQARLARFGCFLLALLVFLPTARPLAAAEESSADAQARLARRHWESVVLFYGDEEDGSWSLRIQDASVKDRAWFEFLELWQFDLKDRAWRQTKTEKYARPIVLPKQKGSDEPQDSQTLYKLEEIPVHTAGLWYAKWKIDGTACGTLMRIGTSRVKGPALEGEAPHGMVKMAMPITLEKAEWMFVPDPRIYCVPNGPGKPVKEGDEGKKADER